MPALTWRNVDAPDFRGVMEGYRGFGDTINTALSRLSQGIEKFDDNKSDAVNKLVQAQLLQFQDPEQYKAALQSGQLINALGSNAGRLDGQTISAMGNRVNTLLEQQYKGLQADDLRGDVADEVKTRGWRDGERASMTALAPYAARAAAGDPTLAADPVYQKALAGLMPDKQFAFQTGAQGVRGGEKDIFGKELNNQAASFRLTIDKRNDEEAQAVKAIGSQLMGLGTEDDVMAALQQVDPKYRGSAYMYYKGLGVSTASGGGGVSGGGGTSNGTGTGEAFDMVVGNGAYGKPNKPLTSMSLGEAIDFGKNTLIPNTKAAGVGRDSRGLLGSSAMGAYQITMSTLQDYAPKVLGANWRNEQMSAANQDKIAEAIFNDNKRGNLKQTWAGLPDTRPGAYANKSWDEMRHIIAGVESKPFVWKPNVPALMGQNISTGINAGVSGDRNAELFQSFQKLAGDTSSDSAISARYTGKGGAFAGMDRGVVLDKIKEVRQRFGVNSAVAADILERSTERAGIMTRWNPLSSNDSGLDFNEDDVNRYGNLFKNGAKGLRNAGASLSIATQANAAAQNAPAIAAKLQADITALARRGQRSPALEAQRDAALAQMGGTFAGTAEVATALNREPQKPQRQQAPVRQAAPAPKPVSRPAQVIAAAARPADVRTGPKRPSDPGYAAEQARNNGPAPVARKPQQEQQTGPAATARALSAAGTAIANALRSPNANSNRERAQLRNALNGLDDMLARGGNPVGTTRAQLLQQRNVLAGQLGIPLRR